MTIGLTDARDDFRRHRFSHDHSLIGYALKTYTRIARFFFIAWIFPFFVIYSVYFGFVSAMNIDFFSYEHHHSVYESGVFLYRIIPKFLLNTAYDLVIAFNLPSHAPPAIYKVWPETDVILFSAFFYVNYFTLGLFLSVVFLVVESVVSRGLEVLTEATVLTMLGLFAFTQNIVVPYDALSYFCLALSVYAVVCRPYGIHPLLLLFPALLIGGLTRETAALILSFFAAWHWRELLNISGLRAGLRHPLGQLAALVAFYIAIYVVLRVLIPSDRLFFTGVRIEDNLRHQFSRFGWLFLASGMAGFCLLQPARVECLAFSFFALPYILMITFISNPREYRLFIPIFLVMILMQVIKAVKALGEPRADRSSLETRDPP